MIDTGGAPKHRVNAGLSPVAAEKEEKKE